MSDKCCHSDKDHEGHSKFDFILFGSLAVIALCLFGYMLLPQISWLHDMAYAIIDLFHMMWWGIVLGIVFIGLMSKVPREYFSVVLGKKDNAFGILRAIIAGLFLDLCNHGIILIAARLYERGVSMAKVMAFLIASPWNSLSLTFILIALIGLKWTLIYIAGSVVIAFVTGLVYASLVRTGVMPQNPNTRETPEGFHLLNDAKERLSNFKPDAQFFKDVTLGSANEVRMLLRWLLLGVVLTAAIRTFIPTEIFTSVFGPTFLGLVSTLVVTTILEVCSEGSAPIASEIVNNAKAPGNGFAFLMAGVATDYTEMLVIREFSKSWMIALSLPLISVPQVLLLGWIMNMAG